MRRSTKFESDLVEWMRNPKFKKAYLRERIKIQKRIDDFTRNNEGSNTPD